MTQPAHTPACLRCMCRCVGVGRVRVVSIKGPVPLQVVSGVLKVFVAALAVARGLGEAAAHSLVTALLPLVLDVAAPEAGPAHPALRDLSLKLIQALATGPSALVFRGAVAALPPSSKQRLQSALQEQGSKRAPDSALKGPTIQLKTFGAASAT